MKRHRGDFGPAKKVIRLMGQNNIDLGTISPFKNKNINLTEHKRKRSPLDRESRNLFKGEFENKRNLS